MFCSRQGVKNGVETPHPFFLRGYARITTEKGSLNGKNPVSVQFVEKCPVENIKVNARKFLEKKRDSI
jgi:hypothetical protein